MSSITDRMVSGNLGWDVVSASVVVFEEVSVVDSDVDVDSISSPQYIRLILEMSLELKRTRCPIASPFKLRSGIIVSLPSIEKADLE